MAEGAVCLNGLALKTLRRPHNDFDAVDKEHGNTNGGQKRDDSDGPIQLGNGFGVHNSIKMVDLDSKHNIKVHFAARGSAW